MNLLRLMRRREGREGKGREGREEINATSNTNMKKKMGSTEG